MRGMWISEEALWEKFEAVPEQINLTEEMAKDIAAYGGPHCLDNGVHYTPKHMAFTSVAQFEDWYRANGSVPSKFLVDFEFLGQSENGLQLIERLNIAKRAILVSSRAEDQNVQSRATTLGLKLLPNALAALTPLEVS